MAAMASKRFLDACVLLAALSLAPAALAEIRIHVGATASPGGSVSDEGVFSDPVRQASGHMFAGSAGDGGSIEAGGLSCLADLCGLQAAWPGANAAATANMGTGHLGVGARAWANPPEVYDGYGFAVVNVRDWLFAPSGTLDFNVRIDVGMGASGPDDTFASYVFTLSLRTDQDHLDTFFHFHAWDDPNGESGDDVSGRGAAFAVNRFWEGPGQGSGDVFDDVPAVFEISIKGVPIRNDGEFLIHNYARAQARDTGVASVSSLNSGYLGIDGDYVSASGYAYPGYMAPVPEPATSALWLLGAGALACSARRRTTRR